VGAGAGGVQVDVVIVALAIVTDNRAARYSRNRRGETAIKSDFKSSSTERVKIRVQASVALHNANECKELAPVAEETMRRKGGIGRSTYVAG